MVERLPVDAGLAATEPASDVSRPPPARRGIAARPSTRVPARPSRPGLRHASAAGAERLACGFAEPSTRAGRRALELARGDPSDGALEPCLLEHGFRKVCPRAVSVRREVPDPVRLPLVDETTHRSREVADVGRASALVVHDGDLVALRSKPQHRAHEVVTRRSEEPRRSDDPGRRPCGSLAVELRSPVCGLRIRAVRLDVRRPLAAVEDVVGREGDDGGAQRGDVGRSRDVHRGRTLRVQLCTVDVRPRRGVQHEVEVVSARKLGPRGVGHVPVRMAERKDVVRGELLSERAAELAARTGDQDSTEASRADRIGVLELHRCATRGSFQGTVCSSGSSASNSTVTW